MKTGPDVRVSLIEFTREPTQSRSARSSSAIVLIGRGK